MKIYVVKRIMWWVVDVSLGASDKANRLVRDMNDFIFSSSQVGFYLKNWEPFLSAHQKQNNNEVTNYQSIVAAKNVNCFSLP